MAGGSGNEGESLASPSDGAHWPWLPSAVSRRPLPCRLRSSVPDTTRLGLSVDRSVRHVDSLHWLESAGMRLIEWCDKQNFERLPAGARETRAQIKIWISRSTNQHWRHGCFCLLRAASGTGVAAPAAVVMMHPSTCACVTGFAADRELNELVDQMDWQRRAAFVELAKGKWRNTFMSPTFRAQDWCLP